MSAEAAILSEQFILCRDPEHVPAGWPTQVAASWRLAHHPSLPVVRIVNHRDDLVGWILGYAVDDEGVLLEGGVTVTAPVDTTDELEQWVYLHAGRFAVVVVTEAFERVYLDAAGSLSMVYSEAVACAASTPAVVPLTSETEELVEEMELVGIPGVGMYPLHLTPRRNVLRLLPNHFLDLRTWSAERHWPATVELRARETAEVVSTVVDRVRLVIAALVEKRPVLQRLTAGRDSRMLLACSRPFADRITFFTAEHLRSDETSWLDCTVAARMSKDLGLRYVRLPRRRPTPGELKEWQLRTGWSVGEEKGRQAYATFKGLPAGHADLVAMCGELGRAEHWPEQLPDFWTPRPGTPHFARDQLLEFFMNLYFPASVARHPRSESTVAEWLDATRSYDMYFVHDLFYIEQRLGTWGGVFPYAFAVDGRFLLFPFSDRRAFEAMMSLPVEARLADEMTQLLIEQEWPELLSYPFNRPQGLRQLKSAQFRALRFSARTGQRLRHPIRSTRRIAARLRRRVTAAP